MSTKSPETIHGRAALFLRRDLTLVSVVADKAHEIPLSPAEALSLAAALSQYAHAHVEAAAEASKAVGALAAH